MNPCCSINIGATQFITQNLIGNSLELQCNSLPMVCSGFAEINKVGIPLYTYLTKSKTAATHVAPAMSATYTIIQAA